MSNKVADSPVGLSAALLKVFEHASDGVAFIDSLGAIVDLNSALCHLMGLSRRELLHRPLSDMMQVGQSAGFGVWLDEFLDGEKESCESVLIRPGGGTVPVEFHRLSSSCGRERVLLMLVREPWHAVNPQVQALLDASPGALVIVDRDGLIVQVSKAFLALWGYDDLASVQGRPLAQLLSPVEVAGEILTIVRRFGSWKGDLVAVASDNYTFDVQLSASVIADDSGEIHHFMIAFHDITERKQTEAELLRLSRAVEYGPSTVMVTDVKGDIEYVNPKFSQVTGYSPQDVIGRNPRILKSGVQSDAFYAQMWQTLAAGNEWRGDLANRRKDGEFYWEFASISPIKNAAGEVTHYVKVGENITERKFTEEALKKQTRELELLNRAAQAFGSSLDLDRVLAAVLGELSQLLDVYGSSVWLVDPESGDIVCRQATGPSQETVRGWRQAPGEGIVGWVAQNGSSLVVQDAHRETRYSRGVEIKAGLDLRSILSVPLRVKQDVIGVLQVVDEKPGRFDAVDLRLLEPLAASAAIAIENAQLYQRAQQELVERKRAQDSLRKRTIELQAINQELDAYAHTVAHDLKNPLGLILGYVELLLADHKILPEESMRQYLQAVVNSTVKMDSIIDELLVLAGVRNMDVQVSPVNMAPVVDEAIRRLRQPTKEAGARIVLPPNWPIALGYAPWLEEVWVNYIGNAIKYGGRPPRVEVGGMRSPDDDGRVRFWVRDNGAGLSSEQQKRLFSSFTRLDQARARGHGLGLSIVKRIIEKLGGEVSVESQVGVGSVFSFDLPAPVD